MRRKKTSQQKKFFGFLSHLLERDSATGFGGKRRKLRESIRGAFFHFFVGKGRDGGDIVIFLPPLFLDDARCVKPESREDFPPSVGSPSSPPHAWESPINLCSK